VLHFEHSFVRYGNWILLKVDQKCLESFEMWCCRSMEISWTDRVEGRNFLHTIKRRLTGLTLSLLMSYIYGPTFGNAESRLFLFAAQCFKIESM
jgi:hypothetical protein